MMFCKSHGGSAKPSDCHFCLSIEEDAYFSRVEKVVSVARRARDEAWVAGDSNMVDRILNSLHVAEAAIEQGLRGQDVRLKTLTPEPTPEEEAEEEGVKGLYGDCQCADCYMKMNCYNPDGKLKMPDVIHMIRQSYYLQKGAAMEMSCTEAKLKEAQFSPNFWSPSITEAFMKRLCAEGTFHRQTHNTHQKKLEFLATRIGIVASDLIKTNPLDYEAKHMWGWKVALTSEERSELELLRT